MRKEQWRKQIFHHAFAADQLLYALLEGIIMLEGGFLGAGSGGLVAGGASIGGEVVRGAVAGGTLTGGDKFGLPGSARGALATCVARSGVLCLTLPLTLYMFLYYDMIFHILCT
ncbi:hypothetical protein V6N11_068649 [Hibiscus sabdariffa]|uniref:Uncharacterized protein n=1 Tax=Hibiscus sabdariffa TaxID=183260 RepID=A0ABR2PAE9_9ROSI